MGGRQSLSRPLKLVSDRVLNQWILEGTVSGGHELGCRALTRAWWLALQGGAEGALEHGALTAGSTGPGRTDRVGRGHEQREGGRCRRLRKPLTPGERGQGPYPSWGPEGSALNPTLKAWQPPSPGPCTCFLPREMHTRPLFLGCCNFDF